MCGICGLIDVRGGMNSDLLEDVRKMAGVLVHRGPDDDGFFHNHRVALGFRRLSIIDLDTGSQPISNETGAIQVVFNGEIYNFLQLRHTLEARGHIFRTRSDTETIVHAYEEYGESCVEHFHGMFAIALWDEARMRLFLARDRLGKKPIYYFHKQGLFAFASELKALLQSPHVPREIDPAAIEQYLASGYIPAPGSILREIYKLSPGHWLTFDSENQRLRVQSYWRPKYLPKSRIAFEDAAVELRRLLSTAVYQRLVSDVPLGALLSGGVDSSIVVGLMAQHSPKPIKTFSIGFEEEEFNELPYARRIAQQFGTDHHEMVVRPQAAEILPELVWYLDEPMADDSVLPSFYLSKMARQHVTVALNGDGGDEVFAGYNSYAAVLACRRYGSLPVWVRRGLIETTLRALPGDQNGTHFLSRARRLVAQSAQPLENQFLRWMTLYDEPIRRSFYTPNFSQQLTDISRFPETSSCEAALGPLDWMLRHDTLNYLPGDLLVKMDRMTMAHSLEARSPFLDHEVVQYVAQLPESYKHRGMTRKRILKIACRDLLPKQIASRPKHGFSVPVDRWFRGPLKTIAGDIIFSGSFRDRGQLSIKQVAHLWEQHQTGKKAHGDRLWALLVLELWQRQFLDRVSPAKQC
jgi:asparagine synthase (glutamine-hydrolysing)